MIDLLKELLPILLSGFLALNVFRFRTRYTFTNLSGEKYVMSLVAWGIAVHAVWLGANILRVRLGYTPIAFTLMEKEVVRILFYSACGTLLGSIVGARNVWERILAASEVFESYENPQTSTHFEAQLIKAIDRTELELFLVELDNDKIYVGLVTNVDVKDDVPFDEKTLSIRPFMSGYRKDDSSEVVYDHHYFSKELRKSFLGYGDGTSADDDITQKFFNEYEQVQDVFFFQRRITSFRRFNSVLYEKFNGQTS